MAKCMAGGPSRADEERWQAENDLRTLLDGAKIKKDKARLAKAMKLAKEQQAALKTFES